MNRYLTADIKGTYKHSKSGELYEFIDVALHTETGEMMVVYQALYEHDELAELCGKHPLFVRPTCFLKRSK